MGGITPLCCAADPQWFGSGASVSVENIITEVPPEGSIQARYWRGPTVWTLGNGIIHGLVAGDQIHAVGFHPRGRRRNANGMFIVDTVRDNGSFTVLDSSGLPLELYDESPVRWSDGIQKNMNWFRGDRERGALYERDAASYANSTEAASVIMFKTSSAQRGGVVDRGARGHANIEKILLEHGALVTRTTVGRGGVDAWLGQGLGQKQGQGQEDGLSKAAHTGVAAHTGKHTGNRMGRRGCGGITAYDVAYRCHYRTVLRYRSDVFHGEVARELEKDHRFVETRGTRGKDGAFGGFRGDMGGRGEGGETGKADEMKKGKKGKKGTMQHQHQHQHLSPLPRNSDRGGEEEEVFPWLQSMKRSVGRHSSNNAETLHSMPESEVIYLLEMASEEATAEGEERSLRMFG